MNNIILPSLSPRSPSHQLTQQSQAPMGGSRNSGQPNEETRVRFGLELAGSQIGSPVIYCAYKPAGRNPRLVVKWRVCKLEREEC